MDKQQKIRAIDDKYNKDAVYVSMIKDGVDKKAIERFRRPVFYGTKSGQKCESGQK